VLGSDTCEIHPVPTPADPVYLDDRLRWWAHHTPDGEAMVFEGQSWSWALWSERVRRAAAGLASLGVGRGHVIAFIDKNHSSAVELTIAAGMLGAATAVLNWRLAGAELTYALADSGARVVFAGEEFAEGVAGLRDQLPAVDHVIGVPSSYEDFLAAAPHVKPTTAGRTPDDVVLVLYSSGTTGQPKGVMLSHRNLLAHVINTGGSEYPPGDKSLVASPLFHVGGSSSALFGIVDGVPTVLTRDTGLPALLGGIAAGGNHTFLVPTVLAQVLGAGPEAIEAFGALKSLTYGASPMPLPLIRRALATWPHLSFTHVYGLTEVSGAVTYLSPDAHRDAEHPERLTSVGVPLPGTEVRVVDPGTGKEVPAGHSGELWLRTNQLMAGFLGKPEATAAAVDPQGWFRTGDVGRQDADGFVYLEDRLKDVVITGGENVYAAEVERVLAEHPAVAEAAIIGVPDDRWGETVKAVVSLAAGASVTEADLIAWCRTALAAYKCPTSVDLVPHLPRNPTGKVLKRELREPYWAQR
jgi:acyl-CoA synthetase (AMP-forming)/AMP-acid ligase II